jgi:SAM-dependent methyltransferase
MLELARVGPQDVVFDLGSGDGRIPIAAAKDFGARGVGVEIDPRLVARAKAHAHAAGVDGKVEFRLSDMYTADLRGATVVMLFLHPEPNLKLRPKLRDELPPGARVVSYMWDMGDWTPDETRSVNRHRIFLWTIRPPVRSLRPVGETHSHPLSRSRFRNSGRERKGSSRSRSEGTFDCDKAEAMRGDVSRCSSDSAQNPHSIPMRGEMRSERPPPLI